MASVYSTDLEAPVISTFRPLRLYGMFVAFFFSSRVVEMDRIHASLLSYPPEEQLFLTR